MSLLRIEAFWDCDGCGCAFSTEMDEPSKPPEGWTTFELAEDSLRAGMTSIEDGQHYCRVCTAQRDRASD